MRLVIKDFAKIKYADIGIDGITVIAGENNTGKSTVGKILFSLFNAMSGIEDKITEQRKEEIKKSCKLVMSGLLKNTVVSSRISRSIMRMSYEKEEIDINEIYELVKQEIERFFPDNKTNEFRTMTNDISREISQKIYEILNLPEETIMLEVLSRYFNNVFHAQVNSLLTDETTASLKLNIKGKNIILAFKDSQCVDFESEISLVNKAVYIDNPFIIDKLDSWDDLSIIDQFLKDLLISTSGSNIMDGIIESVLSKEKISDLEQALQSIVAGRIVTKKEDEFYLEKEGFSQPVSFHNLSTGLKSFVIIKMLIEKGLIKEKDVLILDEPEIHLHPQWQVAYAELIVLLQKCFNLSIVVTTHSPYFLDAINLFSAKHGLDKKVNYYLSAIEENYVKMTCVTDNIDLIYQRMASPIQLLDTLRHELNYR